MLSSMRLYSVPSVRRNLRRAGVLKNRSLTSTLVPCGWAAGCKSTSISRPSDTAFHPLPLPLILDVRARRDTEAILASASPRKPNVATASRSCKSSILLVAWRLKAKANSVSAIPVPSSRTLISLTPPRSISISIRLAPASTLFSTNSLSTEAGRSTTSPAAIWLANCGLRILILDIDKDLSDHFSAAEF